MSDPNVLEIPIYVKLTPEEQRRFHHGEHMILCLSTESGYKCQITYDIIHPTNGEPHMLLKTLLKEPPSTKNPH